MPRKKFSNQRVEQILAHLDNFLSYDQKYNLVIDPLGVHFIITESRKTKRKASKKREKIRAEQKNMTKKQRRISFTKKRTRPKIRTVKKGRTVSLKGQVY